MLYTETLRSGESNVVISIENVVATFAAHWETATVDCTALHRSWKEGHHLDCPTDKKKQLLLCNDGAAAVGDLILLVPAAFPLWIGLCKKTRGESKRTREKKREQITCNKF